MTDRPRWLDIFQTALPMRSFEHAAASRSQAEAIVVRLRTEAGMVGWGETIPREYVTGETLQSVCTDIETIFWPLLRSCQNTRDMIDAVRHLPTMHEGRIVTAARCAVELAAVQALNLPLSNRHNPPKSWPRGSGVLGSADPAKTNRKLRLMRWYGIRHFKLKLGLGADIDRLNLEIVRRQLGRSLSAGRCTLRVDVNGGWLYREVPDRIKELKALNVLAVEQPCFVRAWQLADLATQCELPLIADESLLTIEDAEVLLGVEGRVWLNVRISKNGGLGPSLKILELAYKDSVPCVLGCMVGESGILSLAQRSLLYVAPVPQMLEGNFGRLLLKADLTDTSPRFGYGGRIWPKDSRVFDPHVREDRVAQFGQPLASLE